MFWIHAAAVRAHISTTFAEWAAGFERLCVCVVRLVRRTSLAKKQLLLADEREE
jgi:hypothetical protein